MGRRDRARSADHVPQLGPTRSGARSSPACGWPGTPDVPAPGLPGRAALARRRCCSSPPHALLRQAWAPRRQRHGLVNADGWGVGWHVPGRSEPVRAGARRDRCGATRRSPRVAPAAARRLRAGRGPLRDGGHADRRDRGRAVHRRPWLFSPQRPGRPLGACLARPRRRVGRATPRCLAAHVFAEGPDQAGGDGRVEVAARDPAPGSTCCSPTAPGSSATTWGDTLSHLVADDGVVVASEPYDDDPRWVDVPDRHLIVVTPRGGTAPPRRHRDRTGELMPTTDMSSPPRPGCPRRPDGASTSGRV